MVAGVTRERGSVGSRSSFLCPADHAALAAILDATGRQQEAAELLKRALAVLQRVLGPEHYEVGVTLGSLGTIDARLGHLELAETRLRRALAIKEQWLGPDHLELVPTLGTLGVICRRRGNEVEAVQLYERALGLLDGRVVADHPHIVALKANIATLADEAERAGRRR
jgi:tetratricopeptide (TPR) repeat protein